MVKFAHPFFHLKIGCFKAMVQRYKIRVLRSGEFWYSSDSNQDLLCGICSTMFANTSYLDDQSANVFYWKLPHALHFLGTIVHVTLNWQFTVIWGIVHGKMVLDSSWLENKLYFYFCTGILKKYIWKYGFLSSWIWFFWFGQIQLFGRTMAVYRAIFQPFSQIRIQVIANLPDQRTLILHLWMHFLDVPRL
jgi:hypothetical protein